MFFASHDKETNRRHLTDAGLALLVDEVTLKDGPSGRETFQWVLATRPTGPDDIRVHTQE